MAREGRCTAMVTSTETGRRCGRDALPGMDRCENHLEGRRNTKGPYHLHKFYVRALKPTLAARIEQIVADSAPVEALNLDTELALARDHASNAIELYSKVLETNAGAEAQLAAGTIMMEALKEVAEMCEKNGRVTAVRMQVAGSFVNAMATVITTVCQAAQKVWGDDYRVKEFEKVLREKLEIKAVPGYDGTVLTPDMDVRLMDETVPRYIGHDPHVATALQTELQTDENDPASHS